MGNYVTTRLLGAGLVVLGVATAVFLLARVLPGDPTDVMLGETAATADREALARALGLDRPLAEQWLLYLERSIRLNLGTSLYSQRPVLELILERLPATLLLAVAALAAASCLALAFGTVAAARQGGPWDRGLIACSTLGLAMPNFWLGPLAILVFSYLLGWFPVGGIHGLGSVVLPALTLGTGLAALQARMVRNGLLEVLGLDYVRAARARGLEPTRILARHALPNALLPVFTVFGLQAGALLTGAVVTERIFSWPGVGQLTIEAILRRDYPVLQGCVLFISTIYVLTNLLIDLSYAWLDPRIRFAEKWA